MGLTEILCCDFFQRGKKGGGRCGKPEWEGWRVGRTLSGILFHAANMGGKWEGWRVGRTLFRYFVPCCKHGWEVGGLDFIGYVFHATSMDGRGMG